jgi:hypothetical protein
MNDINEMIKQAYAYGANVALQEAGYAPAQAEAAAIQLTQEKTAEEGEEGGISPALMALMGAGGGALLGAGGGALAGKLTGKNPLKMLSKVAPQPTNAPGVPMGGGMDSAKLKALQEASQLTGGEKAKNMLFDAIFRGGRMGSIRGGAAAGGAGGAGLGAGAGGLYGALSE